MCCELLTGRNAWRCEDDTWELIMAQFLGLCGLRSGVPASLLARSPIDVQSKFSPGPTGHFPLRKADAGGGVEVHEQYAPVVFGLIDALGLPDAPEGAYHELVEFLRMALVPDPRKRPTASELLTRSAFLKEPESED